MQQTQNTSPSPVRLLRRSEVKNLTGLGVSQLYRLMSRGQFPQPVKLSERSVAWLEHEVEGWISQRIAARDADPPPPAPKPTTPGRAKLQQIRQRLINSPA